MKTRIILERLTLYLLIFILVLSMISFIAFLAIETLNLVIFPKLSEDFFYMSLPLMFLAIFILSVFNMALNIGIVSKSMVDEKRLLTSKSEVLKVSSIIVGMLIVFIIITLSSLYVINRNNINKEIREVKSEMEILVSDNKDLINEMVHLFEVKENPERIVELLETISLTSPYFRDLTIIYPIKKEDRFLYKRISKWSLNQKDNHKDFFDYTLGYRSVLRPNKFELEYLDETTNDVAKNDVGVFVKRPYVEIYQPVRSLDGNIVIFLCSDGHQYGVNEYK